MTVLSQKLGGTIEDFDVAAFNPDPTSSRGAGNAVPIPDAYLILRSVIDLGDDPSVVASNLGVVAPLTRTVWKTNAYGSLLSTIEQLHSSYGTLPTADALRRHLDGLSPADGGRSVALHILDQVVNAAPPLLTGMELGIVAQRVRETARRDAYAEVILRGSMILGPGARVDTYDRRGRKVTEELRGPDDYLQWITKAHARIGEQLPPPPELCGSPLPTLGVAQLRDLPPVEWLIDGMVPAEALTELYGEYEIGKSFIGIDLACSVASGTPWLGCFEVSCRGPVVYWVGEGVRDLERRIEAWRTARECELVALGGLRIVAPGHQVDLRDPSTVDNLIATLRETKAVLLIIDTRSRATPGADENSQTDMSTVLSQVTRIKEATGASVLTIHHPNKQGDLRGSNVYPAGVDVVIRGVRKDGIITLSNSKNRYAAHFDDISIELRLVPEVESVVPYVTTSAVEQVDAMGRQDPPEKCYGSLLALLQLCPAGGRVIASDWQAASGLEPRTFLRHRAELRDGKWTTELGKKNALVSPTGKALQWRIDREPMVNMD